MKKYNHLTHEDRICIETLLNEQTPITEIAKSLNRSHSTISREIKRNATTRQANTFNGRQLNDCSTRERSPYVCNGCPKLKTCRHQKKLYCSGNAQTTYKDTLSSTRIGVNLTEQDYQVLIEEVCARLKLGQSLYHIFNTATQPLPCDIKTCYRYISQSVLPITRLDMPRKTAYKKATPSKKRTAFKKRKQLIKTFEHFNQFITKNPDVPLVQMDTVEGSKNSHKALLTIHFLSSNLMLAFLMETQSAKETLRCFNQLENAIGFEKFAELFPVILTDNGSEFSNFASLETSTIYSTKKRTAIYHCDPYSSYQKGAIEKNHELIRYVIPKGTCFDHLHQRDITLMMNHINSYTRKHLDGCSPIQFFKEFYPSFETLFQQLQMCEIPAHNIHLKPQLLK